MKQYKTIIALAVAALMCSAATSRASFYGVAVNNDSTYVTSIPNDPYSGTGWGTPLISSFSDTVGSTTQSGTLYSWATTALSNPYGAGDLTFIFQISENGNTDISDLGLNGFSSLSQVTVNAGSLGVQPTQVNFTSGGTINFDFSSLNTGSTSAYLIVYTSGTVMSQNTANVIDTVTAGASDLAVPEPTTMVAGAMLLLPFGASTLRVLRRKSAA